MTKSTDKNSMQISQGRRRRQVATKFDFILLMLLVLFSSLSCSTYFFRPVNPFVIPTKSSRQYQRQRQRQRQRQKIVQTQINPDDDKQNIKEKNDDAKSLDEVEINTDDPIVEYYQAEEEASRKINRRLMLPRILMTTVTQTITSLAYGFLILSFALNLMGYSLIANDDSGFRIGTLEERRFQMEVIRSTEETETSVPLTSDSTYSKPDQPLPRR